MDNTPADRVIRNDLDASVAGLYASLVAGGLMLAYAIYYVTVVNVQNDYSFLTLGFMTGLTAVSIIGMHEFFRRRHGVGRSENPIEEYGGATAVLMGTLSVVWLSRFAVFYAGPEKGWIEYQSGLVWMPVWLSLLQSFLVLGVMEVSTRMIQRHSLGTLPRTIVVLAPLSLVYSGIGIWLDYARGDLEIFVTVSVLLTTTSAILYSLRLGRAVLYLASSGFAVALPIYMTSTDWGDIQFASLLVPIAIVVGTTATDRSLSKKMIENGSGVVVAAILFCQIISASEGSSFALAESFEIEHPFGLTFWLWLGLLVGWFAPTTMQRTPAMPIGLALALALLADEAAIVGWAVGVAAFVYLETRPQARDWVVRLTFCAMMASWWISAVVNGILALDGYVCTNIPDGSETCTITNQEVLVSIGGYSLLAVNASAYLLFPLLLGLGMWAQRRGRLGLFNGPPMLLLLASLNIPIIVAAGDFMTVLIVLASLYQLILIHSENEAGEGINITIKRALIIAPIVVSIGIQAIDDPKFMTNITMVIPILSAAAIYAICHLHRINGENLILRPEAGAIFFLIFVFLMVNLRELSEYGLIELDSNQRVTLTLFCLTLFSTILAVEGGAIAETSPLEKLVGLIYLLPAAMITSEILTQELANTGSLILRDILVVSAPLVVHLRTKAIQDLSDEARAIGSMTLFLLLTLGLTDVSGGLLALTIFAISVQRATKHVNTPVLLSLPLFALIYSSFFYNREIGADIIWTVLFDFPYLGELTDLTPFETPRWASILLFSIPAYVAFYYPSDRERKEGPRYGSEQLFGPIAAALLGVAVLLPDVRTAPILIVIVLTIGAWRGGVANWFYVNPLASLWAFSSLIDYLNDSIMPTNQIILEESSLVAAGLVSFAQFFFFQKGNLLANLEEESKDKHEYIGVFSRGFGYLFILFSGGISYFLPFLSSILIGWDGLRKGVPGLVKISIFMQWLALSFFLSVDVGIDEEIALLWPIIVGLCMVILSWQRREINGGDSLFLIMIQEDDFDSERDLGLFGSAFILVPMIPLSDYIEFEASFGLSIVILSMHHVVIGFGRDQGWRRTFSLIGMPTGLIVTGTQLGDLVMVLMLFLAALTLIGQAVLYASRGGLELGSTIEGDSPIFSPVGFPSNSQKIDTEPQEELSDNVGETYEEQSTDSGGSTEVVLEQKTLQTTTDPIEENSPLFSSTDAEFGVRLDPSLISNLNSLIISDPTIDFDKWSPVLAISKTGAIVLNWESAEEE